MQIAIPSARSLRINAPLARYLEILRVLAARNIKSRYRGSVLGVYWSLCNPLIMTGIYTAIFGTAFSRYYGGNIWNYVLSCFAALAVLNFFSGTTSQALGSVVGNGALLNKLRLPISAFPLSIVLANLFQYVVGVLPLLAIIAVVSTHDLTRVLWLIVPSVALVMVSTGFGLVAATIYVYFRDFSYLYELILFILWMTSPIFYPIELVPPQLRAVIAFNPIANLMQSVRLIAFNPARPSLHVLGLALLSGVVALAIGIVVFRQQEKSFSSAGRNAGRTAFAS